jgi:TRAP-type C4-dicarboxylate transport system permease small subunit
VSQAPGAGDQSASGWLDRLSRWFENTLLAGVLFGMIGLAAAQVLLRGVAGEAIAWGDEALRLLVLWAAMLGAMAASRDDTHLRIDALSRYLPAVPRNLAAAVVDLFTATVAGILVWYSWRFVADSRAYGDVLLGDLPAWPFQSIMPLAFAFIAWRYLVWAARRFKALLGELGRP